MKPKIFENLNKFKAVLIYDSILQSQNDFSFDAFCAFVFVCFLLLCFYISEKFFKRKKNLQNDYMSFARFFALTTNKKGVVEIKKIFGILVWPNESKIDQMFWEVCIYDIRFQILLT